MKPLDPRLLRYAKDARKYIALLVLLGFFSAASVIAQSMFIAGAISPVIDSGAAASTAVVPGLLALLMFAVRMALTYLQEAYGHRAALRVIADLRTRVLDHASELGGRWLAGGKTASTVSLVTDAINDLEPYFVKFLPQLFLTCTVTPLGILVICVMDFLSALAIVLCIPLIPVFMILIGKMTQNFSAARIAAMGRLGEQLLDLLGGLATLKALGREGGPRKRVRQLGDNYASTTMATLSVAFLSGAVLEFLATLSTAIVAVEVGLRMVGGNISLFTGLTIIMLTPEVFKPLREVGSQFHASADGVSASQKIFDLLDTPLPHRAEGAQAPQLDAVPITVKDLSVQAPGRTTIAPAHLDARIEPGSITALYGLSGGGKSTTVGVLLGLIPPTEGSVLFGDVDVTDVDLLSLWNQITWVPQHPAILPGTIEENLALSDEVALPERERIAELTGFGEVVASLPQGWHTRIGQGGVGLSVGQRQRLALTRALLENKRLVILDEPSAHLDAASERHVLDSVRELKNQGKTVIVIAHRQPLLELADSRVLVESTQGDLVAKEAQA